MQTSNPLEKRAFFGTDAETTQEMQAWVIHSIF